uniref:non-specific serine/threonine protein kinase n=1 Tax=Chlamydomonas leiostraca TaxID=1034604 RepID=A0A7S0RK56_9CHLO|mmetsp:Transcript_25166/g.63861  ORF Transcript_25166/g.63861 Transcript_25166/m.63861 type:complete len:629 (+) Transcript_25166:912-2798(+)
MLLKCNASVLGLGLRSGGNARGRGKELSVIPASKVKPSRNHLVCRASENTDEIVKQVAKQVESLNLTRESDSDETRPTVQQMQGSQLNPGDVLAGKYTIKGVLGAGSNAIAYSAESSDGRTVAVKALSLRSLRDWKQLDLFQREAQILGALSHPGIPKYIDYFEEDSERDRAFYIVQEAVQGKSLAAMLAEGKRCDDAEASRIAREMLEILQYLSGLRPPVVHRDVKPENIILEGGVWGGKVRLVDFGGVQGVAAAGEAAAFASTVVGTYGYMAPEQFRGGAQPASDLYALGATLLFLLSGQPPFAFPQERMRINWRGGASGWAPPTTTWSNLLDGLLEPVAEDRVTASEALALLRGEPLPASSPGSDSKRVGGWVGKRRGDPSGLALAQQSPQSPLQAQMLAAQQLSRGMVTRKPAGSRVILEKTPGRLDITIPAKGLTGDTAMTGVFAVIWNAFVAFWTVGALAGGGILFALFSTPFWFAGYQLARQAFGGALMKERVAVGRNKFRLGQELAVFNKNGVTDFLGGDNEKVIEGSSPDLLGARLITTMFVNDQPQTAIELVEGVRKHRFGEGLEIEEQQWLVYEINSHVEALRGQAIDYDAFPAADIPKTYNDRDQNPFPSSSDNNN